MPPITRPSIAEARQPPRARPGIASITRVSDLPSLFDVILLGSERIDQRHARGVTEKTREEKTRFLVIMPRNVSHDLDQADPDRLFDLYEVVHCVGLDYY